MAFDINTQWLEIMKASPFTEIGEIEELGIVLHGMFCSGTYMDKKSASFAPASPYERRRFQISANEIESDVKLKAQKIKIKDKIYVVLNVRGAECGILTLELEEVKA